MTIQNELKKQLNAIKARVTQAEKVAEKQIHAALKGTEKFREHQMKNVQNLIKKARASKQSQELVAKAEQLRSDLGETATAGIDMLLQKMNLPSKKEVERLNRRLSSMQKRLDELEDRSSSKKA